MTTEGLLAAIRAFGKRRPFQPYLIELVSGDRFRVTHPEAVILRGLVFVHVTPTLFHRLFDSTSVSQLLDEGQDEFHLQ
jgi:hypothetical protein